MGLSFYVRVILLLKALVMLNGSPERFADERIIFNLFAAESLL